MFIPGPLDYLKSHAIAFAAGAVTTVAVHLYARWEKYRANRTRQAP